VYEYRTDFDRFLSSFAVQSAQRIVPKVAAALPIRSVVDFGCGHGAWLSVWAAMGVSVTGIDGPYVDERRLLIDAKDFTLSTLQRRSVSPGNSTSCRA
jgi:2-polyprenyl-3-methyl-5-hydroxy-6-metoxy-1,4-benzoquinol methylase